MFRKTLLTALALVGSFGISTAQTPIVVSPTWSYVNCGEIQVDLNISGGVGPFYVYWSPALGLGTGYGQGLSRVVAYAGEYAVVIRDDGNLQGNFFASTIATFSVGDLGIVTSSTCSSDGAINITPPTDMTPPLQFIWSGPDGFTGNMEDLSMIPSGRYFLHIVDANQCLRTWVYNVQGIPLTVGAEASLNNIDCDVPQGGIDATVSGGVPPYNYLWSNGATTEDIGNLYQSFYWIRATDANGCSIISDWIRVPYGYNIQVTAEVTPTCFLGGSGAIDVDIEGGTPPYSIEWWEVNGFTSSQEDISGLLDGNYYIEVTDANGCFAQYAFTVPIAENYMALSAAITNTPSCATIGAIDLSVLGGTPPLTFEWISAGGLAYTEDLTGLYSGTYQVQVTDADGCASFGSFVVGGTPKSVDLVGSATNTCPGSTYGAVEITMTGGVPPFTYDWSGPGGFSANVEDINGLSAGTYSVHVTDNDGCSAVEVFTVEGVTTFQLSFEVVGCGLSIGTLDLTVTGGVAPLTYVWSTGAVTEDLFDVSLGLYSVTVTDATGCSAIGYWSNKKPLGMDLTLSILNAACGNNATGSIDLIVTGGIEPFTFAWSNGSITEDIANLLPGTYGVSVTDAAGCQAMLDFVVPSSVVTVDATISDMACSSITLGAIDITASGGQAPYLFSWSNGALTEDIFALSVGNYTVDVSDAYGCTTQQTFEVVDISPCCVADRFHPHGTLSSSIQSPASGTIDIQGQFIIDQDFTFSSAVVYMEPGAEIIQLDGAHLWLYNSTFESCQDVMWKGVTTGNGCIVQLKNTRISDAESGIRAMNSSIVLIDGSEFKNNRVGIEVPEQGGVNSVVVFPWNSTFHAEGPLAQPYPGQTTTVGQKGYAALMVSDMALDLTGGGNVIHDMSNGIVANNCDLAVTELSIHDIQPDLAYAAPSNGSAIFARGDHRFVTLKQVGFGSTTGAAPSFQNCRWGIYTEYMNVYSEENTMTNVGTAYHVEKGNSRTIDILNNKLDTRYDGIQLYMNDGCTRMDIATNDITFATNPPPGQFVKGYTAIIVKEANAKNQNSVIQQNTIHYRPNATTAYAGIRLTSANDYKVLSNTLIMHNNANNYAGIYTSACTRPLISCNTVTGSNTNYNVNEGQSAIRNNMGDGVSIVCNDVDATTNGILFSGATLNTDLSGNNIRRHKWGLHTGLATVISGQNLKGNLWCNDPVAGGFQAWSENPNAGDDPFTYFPEVIGCGNTNPVQRSPGNWFQYDTGPNYRCDDGETNYCTEFGMLVCEACKTKLDEKVANDDLENNPYTEETKQILENDLYKKLDNAPIMLTNDQELADFYAAMQNTNVAQFKLINDDYLALYDLDASVTAYLAANKTQIEGLMDQLKLAMQQLADGTLTPTQRQTIMANANGLQLSVRNLTTLNDQALQLAATSKALNADNVKAANNSVGTTELIETNEKQVKEIYLNTVAKEVDSFTSTEVAALFAIANQCPMVGGNAVYRARSLYALIDDDMEYNDASLCLQHGIIYKSRKPKTITEVSIQPNPTNDAATLLYPFYEDMQGTLVIYDALGKEVQRHRLSQDVVRYEFSTAELKQGAYHYAVSNGADVIGTGKLMIVR